MEPYTKPPPLIVFRAYAVAAGKPKLCLVPLKLSFRLHASGLIQVAVFVV